jgi:hypothetical protein
MGVTIPLVPLIKLSHRVSSQVWFFLRIHAPSHLIGLAIKASGIRPSSKQTEAPHASWDKASATNVEIRCYWDEPGLHFVDETASPSVRLWQKPLYLSARGDASDVLDGPDADDLVALRK